MGFIKKIINESNDEIRNKIIKERINYLESETLKNCILDTNTIYYGFISSSSKVRFSDYGYDMNLGLWDQYNMKQQDYLFGFFNYLKDNKNFERLRDEWLDIGIFKNSSMAQCSEYSAITQNLLAFLGFDAYFLAGHLSTSNRKEYHAFNMVKIQWGPVFCLMHLIQLGLYDYKLNLIATKTRFFQIKKEQFENAISGNGLNLEVKTCHYQRKDGKDRVIDLDIWKYEIKGKRKTL